MSEENADKKPKIRHSDTFTIDADNLEKVRRITDQLVQHAPATACSRKQIINWIIEKFPAELSREDLQELSARYYDEERFLRSALTEVRAAKARGERVTIEEILSRERQGAGFVSRRVRRRKTKTNEEASSDQDHGPTQEMA